MPNKPPIAAPSIILVRPQMGENIGAAARAMLNFGLTDLRLVAPRDGWPNQRAIDMAAGAFDIMPQPHVFETLQDAVADLHKLYATTARRRDMVKPVFSPDAAVRTLTAEEKSGFVFGPERTGLDNDEVALCHSILSVETNPDFPSLNLGQSVLLLAYAISSAGADDAVKDTAILSHGDSFPVAQDKMEEFFVRLEDELESGGFFKAKDLKPTMKRNIRNLFLRADLSDQEVRTLHGVLSALTGKKKAAE